MDDESRDADIEDRVCRGGITIICSFSGIAPGGTLYCSVEFEEISDIPDLICVYVAVLHDLLFVSFGDGQWTV